MAVRENALMVSNNATLGHANRDDDDGSGRPANVDRFERDVPLNFWFGPKKIGTVVFSMQAEHLPIDAFGADLPSPPDLSAVRSRLDGVYRPSEFLLPTAPVLGITNAHIRYVESSFHRQFIDLKSDFESYMSKFSGKTRSGIKRKTRKFEKVSGGKIEWSIHRSAAEMDRFHSLAREISQLTYQEKLFDAGIPDDPAFIEAMRTMADADTVRGFILFLDAKPISYLYLPIKDGRVIYGHLGFNPAFAKHSPGTVLQLLALEFLFAENRYRLFDFTEGEGPHKRLFSTSERFCGNVFYLRPTIKNRLIIYLHLAVRRLSDFADGLIVKSGLKERLRQALRGQARSG
jgi:CelD/BcsL family acetyltransferase involved in cellulose biosynthesis